MDFMLKNWHGLAAETNIPGFKLPQLKPYCKVEDTMCARPDIAPYLRCC